jgi:adenosylcobinamide-phosphate synthase
VLIVYLTLGFRHYSHYFTSIQFALNAGDEATARTLLAEWARIDTVGMDATEIARIAVEKSLITTHRNVFGVFFWFLMPLGPACAVMYRVSEYLARAWNEPDHMRNEAFGQFAARAFYWIDWIPGAPDRHRLRRGRQFRGRDLRLAQFRQSLGRRIERHHPGRRRRRDGRAPRQPAENAPRVLPVDAAMVDLSDGEDRRAARRRAERARTAKHGRPGLARAVIMDAAPAAAVGRGPSRLGDRAGLARAGTWGSSAGLL